MLKRLVLFDIDETMISSDGAGGRAIRRMLHHRHGIEDHFTRISMSGKTDPQILHEIMESAGHHETAVQAALEEMIEHYLVLLKEEIPKSAYYIMHEGVMDLLDHLQKDDRIYLALLTGNVERGARMKLEQFGLNKYFPFGAFGSDHRSRLELPAVAQARAIEHYKVHFEPREIVVIGDAVGDIMCAKGFGAISIAVNTGRTSWAELEAQKPHYLFKSLRDTTAVMQAILAEIK